MMFEGFMDEDGAGNPAAASQVAQVDCHCEQQRQRVRQQKRPTLASALRYNAGKGNAFGPSRHQVEPLPVRRAQTRVVKHPGRREACAEGRHPAPLRVAVGGSSLRRALARYRTGPSPPCQALTRACNQPCEQVSLMLQVAAVRTQRFQAVGTVLKHVRETAYVHA